MAKYKALLLCEHNGILPLGLGCLKAYADADRALSEKVAVSIIYLADISAPEQVLAARPDLVGFSCCGDLSRVLRACARLKAADAAVRIVLGGPAVLAVEAAELFAEGTVDFVVRGEGEKAFAALLRFLSAGACGRPRIPGVAFMDNGVLTINPPGPEPDRLDAFPSPYLAGVFDLRAYSRFFVEGSRGCRFSCRYCAESNSRLRYFSPERLLGEVRYILAHAPGAAAVSPTDADFFSDRVRARLLLREFCAVSAGRRVSFVLTTNPRSWDDGMLPAMALDRFHLSIGIQSVNPRVLAASNRPSAVNKLKRNMRRLKYFAPEARFSLDLIDGLPGDNLKGYKNTLDWAISTGADLELNHLMVIPNTYFGRNKARFGIACGDSYPYSLLSNATFSAGEVALARGLAERIDFIAGHLSVDRSLTAVILRLGRALRGRTPWPYLEVCAKLADFMRRRAGFSGVIAGLSGASHGEYTGFANLGRRADVLRLLLPFACKLLARHGRAAEYAGVAAELEAARARLLFRKNTEGRVRAVNNFLAADKMSRRKTLLVCWADSGDTGRLPWNEVVLVRDFLTDESYGNRQNIYSSEPVSISKAAKYLALMAADTGPVFDLVLLSGIHDGLPARRGRGVFKALRGLARPGGRLLVFGGSAGGVGRAGKAAAARELKAAGWVCVRPPYVFAVPAGKKLPPEARKDAHCNV